MMMIVRISPSDRFKIIHETSNIIKEIIPEFRFKSSSVTSFMPYSIAASPNISVYYKK
jgi:hypothetical protein